MKNRLGLVIIFAAVMSVGCDKGVFSSEKSSPETGFQLADDSSADQSGVIRVGQVNEGNDPTVTVKPPTGASCQNVEVTDVVLNVNEIELLGTGSRQTLPATGLDEFSLVNDPLLITPTADIRLHQIRLVLDDADNTVIGSNGTEYPLQTPSQQQSGLKLLVPGKVDLEANQTYSVEYEIDLQKQVVNAGKKCLLKPVMKILNIAPADTCQACLACLAAGGTAEQCTPPCNPNCL